MSHPASLQAAATGRSAPPLSFPFSQPPAPGTTLQVAPGVFWLRMPLPFALDHINLWLLRDEGGWTIVDCGLNTETTRGLWDQIFATILPQGDIRRVIVTHYHPDHFGLAGWLTRRFGVELWMTEAEYWTAHAYYDELPGCGPASSADLFALHGLDATRVGQLRSRGNTYPLGVAEPPPAFRRIMEGDAIGIDGKRWQVMIGYGHAPEHAALYCPDLDVLISGDMVLPKISTNVSVWATEPNGDPLRLFLNSLDRYARLPEHTRVLPSHGLPFHGLDARVQQLHEHHEQRLQSLLAQCGQPVSAADVLPVLFQRALDGHQIFFAMGEAIAHLNHLMHQGKLQRDTGADGCVRFAARS
jgi:glyoxylase-like metal-dependent hydrolase (beta-lactamase superfamily II)